MRYERIELDIVKEDIAKYAHFSLGKERIISCSPHHEFLSLNRELQRSKEALAYVYHYGDLPFSGIRDISPYLEDAKRNLTLTCKELREIADEIYGVEQIAKAFHKCEIKCDRLLELVASFSHELSLASEIVRCISLQYEVNDNASSKLKQLKKAIKLTQNDINSEASKFIAKNSNLLMDSITTLRGNRCCVLVKISEKNKVDGIIHGESSSKQSAYFEPKALMHLNNKLETLMEEYKEEIQRILFELSQQVKKCAHALMGNLETLAILDEVFAKALWGKVYNGCIAQIDLNHEHLYLKQARHPLIDQNKVIANTYEMNVGKKMILISGSNTGGKSVALKTIGLFSAMTLCGMVIPCEEAIIPLFDEIYISIGDEQSIQESLSTFSGSISTIASILKNATSKSLVLLDEIGNGTDPKEGEALALAIIEKLRDIKCMVVTTTHFASLKSYGATCDDILLASVEFDMDKLEPTYRYIEGMSQGSYAFLIAQRYGLEKDLIDRAIAIKEASESVDEKLLQKLQILEQELYLKESKIQNDLQKIEQLKQEWQTKNDQFEVKKAKELEVVKEEQNKAFALKMEEAQLIIDEIKSKQNEMKPHEHIALKHELQQILENKEEEVQDYEFKVDDYVCIKSMNYYGTIISLKKDQAQILVNGMKMKAKLTDLKIATKQNDHKKASKKVSKDITVRSFPLECNLIGQRVEEGLAILDKYLDNALLSKVYQVRVIHGFGTGKLRQGVHNYLKKSKIVESFSFAASNEGGLGATVVKLKHKGK